MMFERDLLGLLQSRLGGILTGGLFFGKAPETAREPFGVLATVAVPGAREAGALKPWMQLDVFCLTGFDAAAKAEEIASDLLFLSGRYGDTAFERIVAERSRLIECEDGTWKAPIDIRVHCRRIG